jgi:L-fucose mutarotase/ribose pyranase (RbsD/FucU family)
MGYNEADAANALRMTNFSINEAIEAILSPDRRRLDSFVQGEKNKKERLEKDKEEQEAQKGMQGFFDENKQDIKPITVADFN